MSQDPLNGKQWDVWQGDCLDLLKRLPDGCVDAVVTDPPYGIDFPYAGYTDSRGNLRNLIDKCYPDMVRVAKKRLLIMCGPTQISLWPEPDWVSVIVWNTTGSYGKAGFNQWTPILIYGADVKGFGSVNGILKSDVISINGGSGVGFTRSDQEKLHSCPKPINMMHRLIKRYIEPGSLVLDPFCGSGSTGVACAREEMRFIGMEISEEYCDIARARIAAAAAQPRLEFDEPQERKPEPKQLGMEGLC